MNYMAGKQGSEDVYATFNVLMRRKVGAGCLAVPRGRRGVQELPAGCRARAAGR